MITSPSWTSYLSSWLWENDPVTSDVDMNYSFLNLTIQFETVKAKNQPILDRFFHCILEFYWIQFIHSESYSPMDKTSEKREKGDDVIIASAPAKRNAFLLLSPRESCAPRGTYKYQPKQWKLLPPSADTKRQHSQACIYIRRPDHSRFGRWTLYSHCKTQRK